MSESIWTIECAGGCGRVLHTDRPTVLWTVTTCPECAAKAVTA